MIIHSLPLSNRPRRRHRMKLVRSVAVLLLLCCVPAALAGPPSDEERRHWSFQPLLRPGLPRVRQSDQVRTPIDTFVLAILEAKELTFSADAPTHVLVRRVYLDLLGLPPSLDEIDAFLNDHRPD